MRHADRPPIDRRALRWYEVILHDGRRLTGQAEYRAMARHYSRSWRDDYVGSKTHYMDVKSVRIIRHPVSEEIPF